MKHKDISEYLATEAQKRKSTYDLTLYYSIKETENLIIDMVEKLGNLDRVLDSQIDAIERKALSIERAELAYKLEPLFTKMKTETTEYLKRTLTHRSNNRVVENEHTNMDIFTFMDRIEKMKSIKNQ